MSSRSFETFGGENSDGSVLKTILICVCFHMLYFVVPACLIITPVALLLSNKITYQVIAVTLIALYASTFDGSHRRSGKPWPWFVNLSLHRFVLEWLPIQIRRTTVLNPDGLYVFACHPHGTLAFNRGAVGFSIDTLWNAAFPGVNFRVLTATAAFFVPFIREMWLWSYCVDASKATAVHVMSVEKCSVFVYPGGEKEQLETVFGEHRVLLSHRKGFVRLALEQGASLVPVYAFGETNLYYHSQAFISFRRWLVQRFGVAIPLLSGRFGLMPFRERVTLVFGSPIAVDRISNPSADDIDALHKVYIDHLVKLFNDHKESLGYGDKTLHIM